MYATGDPNPPVPEEGIWFEGLGWPYPESSTLSDAFKPFKAPLKPPFVKGGRPTAHEWELYSLPVEVHPDAHRARCKPGVFDKWHDSIKA